ncbi:MAG: hypothetical protein ABWZ77_05195 [Naasia sp.]
MPARPLRTVYAQLATTVHQAWLYRRDRDPLVWTIPIALLVAVLRPR